MKIEIKSKSLKYSEFLVKFGVTLCLRPVGTICLRNIFSDFVLLLLLLLLVLLHLVLLGLREGPTVDDTDPVDGH